MLVTLPCVLLLLDYWPLRRWQRGAGAPDMAAASAGWGRLLAEKLPLLALAAAASFVTLQAQRPAMIPAARFPLFDRIENALVSYAAFLAQTASPFGLVILNP